MQTKIKRIKNLILDTLFPISCISCRKGGDYICDDCLEKIPILVQQACPVCEKITMPRGEICHNCKSKTELNGILIATRYKYELIKKAVHLFKYRFIDDLGKPLGKVLAKAFVQHNVRLPDLIIPIPLHQRRLRWRGFNQAELLAREVSKNIAPGMKIPVKNNILIRRRYTPPQMKIENFSERRKNLSEAFRLNPDINGNEIKGKNILLIDDIATTGTTIFECSQILSQLNPRQINGLIIARQEFSKK